MYILKEIAYCIFVSLFLPFLCILFNILYLSLKNLCDLILYLYNQDIGRSESFISLMAALLTVPVIFEAPRKSLINRSINKNIDGVFQDLDNKGKEIKDILLSETTDEELSKREKIILEKCKKSKILEFLFVFSIIIGIIYCIILYLGCSECLGFLSILGFIPFFLYLYNVSLICRNNKYEIIKNIKNKASNSPLLITTDEEVTSLVVKMRKKVGNLQSEDNKHNNDGCCLFRASCPHCPKNLPQ